MTAVSPGVPEVPVRPVAERRASRRIQVGPVAVGGGAPASVQSMTTTRTSDIGVTLQQIAELTASGCQIVRVACPTQDDADALATIAPKSQIPVIADIHFQPKYVFAAIEASCAAVRVDPGNTKQPSEAQRPGAGLPGAQPSGADAPGAESPKADPPEAEPPKAALSQEELSKEQQE